MKFMIGYGVTTEDFDVSNDTLLMGETGMVNQLEVRCPEIPKGFVVEKITYPLDESLQATTHLIEINSIEELLQLGRELKCDLVLERQPQEMLESVGIGLPEFCIVVEEREQE